MVRALISSIGAGGSLIAAALTAAALVAGVTAFRGWVDGAAEGGGGVVGMVGAEDDVAGRGERERVAVAVRTAGPRAVVAAADRAPRRSLIDRRPDRDRRGVAMRPGAAPPPAGGGAPAAPRPGREPAAAAPAPSRSGPTQDPPAERPAPPSVPAPEVPEAPVPQRPVSGVVQQTHEAAAPVVDALPEPVRPPVDAVTGALEDTAGLVDDTLAPLLRP
jgi:hypothetical protein